MDKTTISLDYVKELTDKYRSDQGGLIGILEEVQARYGYLPREVLESVSEETGHSLVDIFGVATFYKSFSLTPRGRHQCSVCLGTACHVRGGSAIAEEFSKKLGIKAGETTADNEFSLETVNCLGACALGPVVVVDGHYFSQVNVKKVKEIIDVTKNGYDAMDTGTDEKIFPINVNCSRCNHSLMTPEHFMDGYPAIWVSVSFANKHGWLRLSSLYGSYKTEAEYEIPDDKVVNFFCPHCHSELLGSVNCPECGVPMVLMSVSSGGIVQICPRKGCKGHVLDL